MSYHTQVVAAARETEKHLSARVRLYWYRNGTRKHWWQRGRDPLAYADELLLAQAQWMLQHFVQREPE